MSTTFQLSQRQQYTLLNALLLSLALALTLFSGDGQAAKLAPDFTVTDLNGKSVKLSSYRGKVVYLDFWASWCRPCQKSFPWMRRMQSKYEKKGLVILAVNLDNEKKEVHAFLADNRANFKVLLDPQGKVAEKYHVQAMPSSYLIDAKGYIKKVHYGFMEKDADNKEMEIANLLKSK